MGALTPAGGYVFPIVVVLIPRQSGKTSDVLDMGLGRCLSYKDYRVAYAAQNGHKTSERFRDDLFPAVESSALAGRARLRRSQGTERISFPGGSYLKAFPAIAGSLRSDALDLVIVDESQEHEEALGRALDETIVPVFTTRPRRQLWIVGTAGTDNSAYLRRYLEQARAGVPGFGLVEYGAEDETDTADETLWESWHPGLVSGLADREALRLALSALGPAGFAREYGNQWTRTAARAIDAHLWRAVQLFTDNPRPAGPYCLGIDVAADRGSAAIAIATAGGYLEVIEVRPGVEWLVPQALALSRTYAAPVAGDRYGATGPTMDALERAAGDRMVMAAGDTANAAAGFLDALAAGRLEVYPSKPLSEAVAGAVKRPLGDSGGFVWARSAAAAEVAPLRACCAALWGSLHRPALAHPAAYAL